LREKERVTKEGKTSKKYEFSAENGRIRFKWHQQSSPYYGPDNPLLTEPVPKQRLEQD